MPNCLPFFACEKCSTASAHTELKVTDYPRAVAKKHISCKVNHRHYVLETIGLTFFSLFYAFLSSFL